MSVLIFNLLRFFRGPKFCIYPRTYNFLHITNRQEEHGNERFKRASTLHQSDSGKINRSPFLLPSPSLSLWSLVFNSFADLSISTISSILIFIIRNHASPFGQSAVLSPAVRAKKEECTRSSGKKEQEYAGRARASKLRHFNLPVASREEREILIDSSFWKGYPVEHDGKGWRDFVYRIYGPWRVCTRV